MFNNKFNSSKTDPLVEAVKQAQQDGDLRRKAEAYVNEEFGVYSRKAVVREHLAAYDARLEEMYRCVKEGKPLSPKQEKMAALAGNKNKIDADDLKALRRGAKLDEKKGCYEEGNDGNLANNYPPYDKVTRGDVIAGATGKDQMGGKKKVVEKKMYEAEDTGTSEPSEVSKQAGAKQEKETPEKDYSRTQMDNLVKKVVKEALGQKQTPRYPAVEKISANKVKGQPLPSETRHPNPGAVTRVAGQQALAEKAPPGAKMERMVKHIKKGYADDGELTKKEKGIAYATAWKAYGKHKKGLEEETVSIEEVNESFAAFVAEAINEFALAEHPEATVENLHMFNEAYVVACLEEAYACSDEKMKKHEEMKKDLKEAAEAFGKEKEEKGEKKHKEGKEEESKEKAKKVLAKLKESRSFNAAQKTDKSVNEALPMMAGAPIPSSLSASRPAAPTTAATAKTSSSGYFKGSPNVSKGDVTVGKGQTLSGIAKQYGTSVGAIQSMNKGLDNPNKIAQGAKLNLPTTPKTVGPPAPEASTSTPPASTRQPGAPDETSTRNFLDKQLRTPKVGPEAPDSMPKIDTGTTANPQGSGTSSSAPSTSAAPASSTASTPAASTPATSTTTNMNPMDSQSGENKMKAMASLKESVDVAGKKYRIV